MTNTNNSIPSAATEPATAHSVRPGSAPSPLPTPNSPPARTWTHAAKGTR